jgi:hypothetical protein
MGIKLIADGTVAPWTSKVVPPVTRGLEAWFTFDTDTSRFGFNRAIGKENAVLVGAPTAFPTHGRFKGLSNYLQTPIVETDEQTLIVVGKLVTTPVDNATSALLVGNYIGTSVTPGLTGAAAGVSIYFPTASLTAQVGRSNGSGGIAGDIVAMSAMTPATSWAIRALRTKSGQVTKLYDLTANITKEGVSTASRGLSNTKFRVGSGTSGLSGESDISAAAIYSKCLTDEEIELVAAVMRKRMARLGVTV